MQATHKFDHNDNAGKGLAELVSKRMAPNADWTAMSGSDHFVQFYESDEYIVNSVAEYLFHGIKSNETCILAATAEHTAEIERIATGHGAELERARVDGRYIALDAQETIDKFMVDGMPDKDLFDSVIGTVVAAGAKRGRVRIFGEMVAVLLAAGNPKASLRLEELWNELRAQHRFSLFCAYSIDGLAANGRSEFMEGACKTHSRVIPSESYTSLNTADERLRSVAFLQQRGRQLEAEIAELERRISAKQILAPNLA